MRKFILTPIISTHEEKLYEFKLDKASEGKVTKLIERLQKSEMIKTNDIVLNKKHFSRKIEEVKNPLAMAMTNKIESEKCFSGKFLESVASSPKRNYLSKPMYNFLNS